MAELTDFAIPVRRSVIKRDLIFGIPLVPLMIIIFLTIIFVLTFEQISFLAITVLLFVVFRNVTKADEWLLDILVIAMLQPDQLR